MAEIIFSASDMRTMSDVLTKTEDVVRKRLQSSAPFMRVRDADFVVEHTLRDLGDRLKVALLGDVLVRGLVDLGLISVDEDDLPDRAQSMAWLIEDDTLKPEEPDSYLPRAERFNGLLEDYGDLDEELKELVRNAATEVLTR